MKYFILIKHFNISCVIIILKSLFMINNNHYSHYSQTEQLSCMYTKKYRKLIYLLLQQEEELY